MKIFSLEFGIVYGVNTGIYSLNFVSNIKRILMNMLITAKEYTD